MATKTREPLFFNEIGRTEVDRKTTIVSEAPYPGGKLIRVESTYRNRDGSAAIAEALTFVPGKPEKDPERSK